MQLVRIAGPTEAMLLLAEVDGLDFERTSASRLDDDTWQVAGYATDEALAEIERRGLTAELVVAADELSDQRAALFSAITRDEPPDVTDAPDDEPGAEPGDERGPDPGDEPGAEPGDERGPDPGDEPGTKPGDEPADEHADTAGPEGS